MNFVAIARTDEEDVFYNVKKGEDTNSLNEECFLPSEDLAKQIIVDELCIDYKPVAVTLEVLERSGSFTYGVAEIEVNKPVKVEKVNG
ncbi:hypothetical protein [Bacillus mycoides]|uniref:hypothetical protein n=1 Tax=Bacillus mycoides TaxID=1405 RepID=UPI003A7FDA2E